MQTKPIPSETEIRSAYQQGVEAVILLFEQTFFEMSERLRQVEDRLSQTFAHLDHPQKWTACLGSVAIRFRRATVLSRFSLIIR